ncbi:MAG TPA: hypothetical protein VMT16_04470 [Thermoanaerobaculia bacterium]|nr:hypothetical protein [Thermoanaerobaculia bacterium]
MALLAILLMACQAEVLHDVPEAEANEILAVLQQHGVVADKVPANPELNTFNVTVSKDARPRAWAVLQEYKLPRARDRRFRDVFGKSKLVVTPVEERALFLEALQGELAQTLESVQGVIDARVHLVLPEKDLSGKLRGAAKASVVLEYLPSAQGVAPMQRAEVQQIVANAVDGLDPDTVAVVLKPSSIAAPKSGQGGDFDLIRSAGLLLEKSSVQRFKVYVATATMLLAVLGLLLFMEGRSNNKLRERLQLVERELRVAERAAATPQKVS